MNISRFVLIFMCALLAGCTAAPAQQPASPLPVGTPVPYSILLSDQPGMIRPLASNNGWVDPGITAIESLESALQYSPPYSQQVMQKLRLVEFDKFLVLLIAQGDQGTTGYAVVPNGIYAIHPTSLIISADFIIPGDWQVVGEMETSPFVLLEIPKDALPTTPAGLFLTITLDYVEITPVPPKQ